MFQYTKENILNKVDANTFQVVTDAGSGVKKLVVAGLGEYVVDNIVDKTIYRTKGKEGKPAVATLAVPEGEGERILTFRVITPNQYLAEYASPNWQVFGKPIIAGFNGNNAVDAVKLAIPEGNKFVNVAGTANNITLTATTPYMDFDKAYVTEEDGTIKSVSISYTQKRVEPFATKDWLIENLRFPTYPNIRYASAGNVPTEALYDELSFTYKVPRVGLGGLSGVGQAIDAVTRHIFYVPAGTVTSITDFPAFDEEAEKDASELLDEYETEEKAAE